MLVLLLGVLASACAAGAGPGSSARPAPASPEEARAVVLETALTDVRTGESFALSQFHGKVVVALGMAVW